MSNEEFKNEDKLSAAHVVDVLNRVFEADPKAISDLIEARVPCNRQLADDPTVQVSEDDGKYLVGLLGIVNGLVGVNEQQSGFIAAEYQVMCPNPNYATCRLEEPADFKDMKIGDFCPSCSETLVGYLTGFKKI